VSLAQLQAWSDLPAGSNLFDSLVAFENYPMGEEGGDGVPGVAEVGGLDTSNFPLCLRAHVDDELHLELSYDPHLFDEATVRAMAGHLGVLLLAGIATRPDAEVGRLPVLTGAELHRMLTVWNRTGPVVPGATFADLVQAQVIRTPDAPAVLFDGGELSYAELNARPTGSPAGWSSAGWVRSGSSRWRCRGRWRSS
jgi:non-ribosomal peptide synthetase component F